ncbi:hypothetical protein OK016_01135 [Vibrio chagasii]|nr:hypothetical protein [Vibrio chagasii]
MFVCAPVAEPEDASNKLVVDEVAGLTDSSAGRECSNWCLNSQPTVINTHRLRMSSFDTKKTDASSAIEEVDHMIQLTM